MITTVLVDDMRPALQELKFLLKKYLEIKIIGMYTDPITAIEKIAELKPKVVFLDIHMPQLKGIDACSKILDLNPETEIIFVTAFDQYAVEAFELHALDYLLKPIDEERLEKTITRIKDNTATKKEDFIPSLKLQIRCLGQFRVSWENQESIKWRTEKNKELFAYLLQNSGRGISKDELLDKLWPEDDPVKAIRQLYNGIYYIRKALQEYGIDENLIRIGSNYNLELGQVDLDIRYYHEFEKNVNAESIEKLEALEALYKGDYLEGEYYPWADYDRERLSILFQQCLIKLFKLYKKENQFSKAESKLIKAYRRNPYEERITELLLKLYGVTGERTKAIKHFKAYAKLIEDELGIKPSKEIVEMYNHFVS